MLRVALCSMMMLLVACADATLTLVPDDLDQFTVNPPATQTNTDGSLGDLNEFGGIDNAGSEVVDPSDAHHSNPLIDAGKDAQPDPLEQDVGPPPQIQDGGLVIDRGGAPRPPDDGGVLDPQNDGAIEPPMMEFRPTRVETRLQFVRTVAGEANRVTCDVFDMNNQLLAGVQTAVRVNPNQGFERDVEGLIGTLAQEYTVQCIASDSGLFDQTPSDWEVRPGPPEEVITNLSDVEVLAGDSVEVECVLWDAYGNLTTSDELEIQIDPAPARIDRMNAHQFSIQTAGNYDITCHIPGVRTVHPASLYVDPNLPASLSVEFIPNTEIYGLHELLQVVTYVEDIFGNEVADASVNIDSEPELQLFGQRRIILDTPGSFLITVDVEGATHQNRRLEESISILVDGEAPRITCLEPAYGTQVVLPLNRRVRIEGVVFDAGGVREVRLNGLLVPLDADGHFEVTKFASWGINVYEVIATDLRGDVSSAQCSFFAAYEYANPDVSSEDIASAFLGPLALDDGDGMRPFESIADILRTAINSDQLAETISQQAAARNPIVPTECRVRLPVINSCLFSAGLEFQSLDIEGPNDVALNLVEGGLELMITIREIDLGGQLSGTLSNEGIVSADFVRVLVQFGVELGADGNINVTLEGINEVLVGDISSDFSGLVTGTALEAMVWIIERFFLNAVVNRLTSFLEEQLRNSLAQIFNNIRLSGLSTVFDVPGIAGGAATRLHFSSSISSVEFNEEGATFSASIRVSGDANGARSSLGVAVPPGQVPDPSHNAQASAVVDIKLVNQVLYQLWRGAYFERQGVDLVANLAEGFEGFEVSFQLPVAPAAVGKANGSGIRVHFGPLLAQVHIPLLEDAEIGVRASAEVDVGVRLRTDNTFEFGPIDISELNLMIEDDGVGFVDGGELRTLITQIIEGAIDQTLNEAIPTLPIPTFQTPEALVSYGVPRGITLGVINARLTTRNRAWSAAGQLGEIINQEGLLCENTCRWAGDQECDDGGPQSSYSICDLGSDCEDCGPRLCTDTCRFADDDDCDDGGPDSDFSLCELGSDCTDCGAR